MARRRPYARIGETREACDSARLRYIAVVATCLALFYVFSKVGGPREPGEEADVALEDFEHPYAGATASKAEVLEEVARAPEIADTGYDEDVEGGREEGQGEDAVTETDDLEGEDSGEGENDVVEDAPEVRRSESELAILLVTSKRIGALLDFDPKTF